ncbi:hypothetical protein OK074_7793 [Actinobacteria bacterium OK074]|nr:hypothetical protein OK074_7793 [Actinobacteria bacterium OK074]
MGEGCAFVGDGLAFVGEGLAFVGEGTGEGSLPTDGDAVGTGVAVRVGFGFSVPTDGTGVGTVVATTVGVGLGFGVDADGEAFAIVAQPATATAPPATTPSSRRRIRRVSLCVLNSTPLQRS